MLVATGMLLAGDGPGFDGARSIEDGDLLPLPVGLELEADGLSGCGSLECGRSFLVSGGAELSPVVVDLVIDHLVSAHGWGDVQAELRADGRACIEDGSLCVQAEPVDVLERANFGRRYELDEADVNALPDDLVKVSFSSCCGDDFSPWAGSLPGTPLQLAALCAVALGTTAACALVRRSRAS